MDVIAVIGAGRIGRQIALAFALGGCRVRLCDVKARSRADAGAVLADARREIERDLEEKIARSELGPKTGRGFFDYAGDRRDAFETTKLRALLRQLKREREAAPP